MLADAFVGMGTGCADLKRGPGQRLRDGIVQFGGHPCSFGDARLQFCLGDAGGGEGTSATFGQPAEGNLRPLTSDLEEETPSREAPATAPPNGPCFAALIRLLRT